MNLSIGDGYLLRELRDSDADALFDLMARREIERYLPDRFESIDEMREIVAWLRSNYGKPDYDRLTYAIARGDELVGWVSAGPLPSDESRRELAYCVLPELHGRGLASRAAQAFTAWLRDAGLAGELWAEVDEDNAPSIRVLGKCGFEPAGALTAELGKARRLLFRSTES